MVKQFGRSIDWCRQSKKIQPTHLPQYLTTFHTLPFCLYIDPCTLIIFQKNALHVPKRTNHLHNNNAYALIGSNSAHISSSRLFSLLIKQEKLTPNKATYEISIVVNLIQFTSIPMKSTRSVHE